MTKKLLISLIFILLSVGISFSEDAKTEYLVQTSLRNGTTQNTDQLKFNYSLRYKNSEGKLQYIHPSSVHLNKQLLAPTGKNYYLRLSEGKNTISIQYLKNGALNFDTYTYYLDTTPPYINVSGIYNYMTSNTSHIKFSAKAGDALSVPEAIRLKVMLNDKELNPVNGEYRGILNQSLANYSSQKEATNDNHPTDNIVSIEATDGQGNQTIKTYHITYTPNEIDYNQMRYLIEKVPGLISQNDLYDTIGRYSPVGVALDDSNITVLGTFGGYVVLGHDVPIYNHEGDDFVVNAHWSDQDIPLTSVMVMEDTNANGIPDDTWYRIKDSFGEDKEGRNYTINYSFDEKGEYTTYQGGSSQLQLETPVTTPLPSSYLETAKELNWKQFRPTHYVLDGNIKYMHDKEIKALHLATKGYNIDNAYDKDGKAVNLTKIDFVKVYSNTLDSIEDIGSVMPGVNYVMPLRKQEHNLNYNADQLIQTTSFQSSVGDLLCFIPSGENLDVEQVILNQSKPLVNNDHVFIYPERNLYDYLPYKIDDNRIMMISPYNRSKLIVTSLSDNENIFLEISKILELYSSTSEVQKLEWLDLINLKHKVSAYLSSSTLSLTTIQEGSLELLEKNIENRIFTDIESAIIKLSNSNDEIYNTKWMIDFLSDDEFEMLDAVLLEKLEEKLLKLCNYKVKETTLISKSNMSYSIKPIKNVAYTLSLEEYEREVLPKIIITQREYSSETSADELSFDVSYLKDDKMVGELYRAIEYELKVSDGDLEYRLYHTDGDKRTEVSTYVDEVNSRIGFSTDQLGGFIWMSSK